MSDYKSWLHNTRIKLKEWSDSCEDDIGNCPLSQDSVGWIISYLSELESENARLKEELEKFKEGANKSVCTYCGHVGPKDVETMLQHMVVCEKHPTLKLIEKANELLQDRDRLKAELEKKEMLIRSNEAAWVRNHALIAKADRWRTLAGKMVEALKEIQRSKCECWKDSGPVNCSCGLEFQGVAECALTAYEFAVKEKK